MLTRVSRQDTVLCRVRRSLKQDRRSPTCAEELCARELEIPRCLEGELYDHTLPSSCPTNAVAYPTHVHFNRTLSSQLISPSIDLRMPLSSSYPHKTQSLRGVNEMIEVGPSPNLPIQSPHSICAAASSFGSGCKMHPARHG